MEIRSNLQGRYKITMDEYDKLVDSGAYTNFGVRDKVISFDFFRKIYEQKVENRGLLVLKNIKDYHREYSWS